jgi:hypothetical protein
LVAVGAHVASLLAAAEEAASQILHEANHEAEAIRADAQGEAARVRDQAVAADTGGNRQGVGLRHWAARAAFSQRVQYRVSLRHLADRAAFSDRVQYRALRVMVSSSGLVLATVLMLRLLGA